MLKERGFIDFYWLLLKDLSEKSRGHVQNIADILLTLTNPRNKKDFKRSFNRLISIAKTIRLKIWANYSYAINIAFGHKGILLASQLIILRAWDGVLLYLMRLLDKFRELDENDLKKHEKIIYKQLYQMAKKLKETVDLSKRKFK